MKYKTAVEYKLLKQVISLGIFFVWWILFGIAFPIIGIWFSGSETGLSADVLFPIIFFSIIISFIGGGADFKFFIQNGLSRFDIFLVNLSTISLTSFITSILVFSLSKISFSSLDLSTMITSKGFYYNDNPLLNILLLFMVIFFFSSFGLLVGTFNDMFTGLKKIIILLLAMALPIIIATLIQLGGDSAKIHFANFLKYILGYSNNQSTLSSVPFMLTLFFFSALCFSILFVLNHYHEVRHKSA
ncbi:ABC transporter permease [Lactococcus garvieae]|uniref:ABC transporter permease n=1 Tax=Lactococcus garvieae TaxID=1363 RepID=UPI0009C0805D|nr:ABC transporter permease [Lactococcus garvieae]